MKNKIFINLLFCALIFTQSNQAYGYNYINMGAKAIAAITAAAITTGAFYQYFSTKKDDLDYQAPGRLIDLGGYSLHINCTGEDVKEQPTVVLDAGLGGSSLDWLYVQTQVEKFARVCSYDRAGHGWSDESPKPRTSEHIAQELHELLAQAKEDGPFILVGHSFGGINVRVFAHKYPEQVAGIVLVDASHEDYYLKSPKQPTKSFISGLPENLLDYPKISSFLTHVGVTRAIIQRRSYEWLREDIRNKYKAKASTIKFIRTVYTEKLNFAANLTQLKQLNSDLKNTPLTVITAGKEYSNEGMTREWAEWSQKERLAWRNLQEDLVSKSSNSKHVIAENSGHAIPSEQPEIIVDEIKLLLKN